MKIGAEPNQINSAVQQSTPRRPFLLDSFLKHYIPLISDFRRDLEVSSLEELYRMPEPFLPLFGNGYERSALRMAIVGQDTKGYGNLQTFLDQEKAEPGKGLRTQLANFQKRDFVGWGNHRYTFFGFVMMFMAALHRVKNWEVMKRGVCREVLSSFVWGNGNAIEYWKSSASKAGVPLRTWAAVKEAGTRLDGIKNLVQALRPKVVLVLWKNMSPKSYFDGYDYTMMAGNEPVRHYRIPAEGIDIFHVPHPTRMKFEGGAGRFCDKLTELFYQNKLTVRFPNFVQGRRDSNEVVNYLQNSAPPGFDKFELVAWVAEELKKRDSFMSVPTLCCILNHLGRRTNYGSEFSGKRGSYRLVRSTYYRLKPRDPDQAAIVAEAFRRPNFQYAYSA
jgi:hypothetical protein